MTGRFATVVTRAGLGAMLAGGLVVGGIPMAPARASTAPALRRPRIVFPTRSAAARRHRVAFGSRVTTSPLSYHGGNEGIGVVTGPPKVYLVFWGSQWGAATTGTDGNIALAGDTKGMAPRLQNFFRSLGVNNETWSGVVTQYCQGVTIGTTSCPTGSTRVGYPTGGALAGVWVDNASAAPTAATPTQLGSEAIAAAGRFNNLTSASNQNAQYLIVSPPGTHPDNFNGGAQFCAWHDYRSAARGGSPYGVVAFTNLPYIPDAGAMCGANYVNAGAAGTLDGVTMVAGHEYAETITDPTLRAWFDAAGEENADKCSWNGVGGNGGSQNYAFVKGSFAVQGSWSNDTGDCRVTHAVVGGVTTSSFTLSVPSVSTTPGASPSVTVATTATGTPVPITLSVSGLPAGVTAAATPNPVTAGATATLKFTVASTTKLGAYPLVVTGTATSSGTTITRTATMTLAVGSDFTVAATSVSGAAGSTPTSTITTSTPFGNSVPVALSVSGLPTGVSAAFAATPVTSGAGTTLRFTIGTSAKTGSYPLVVAGTAVVSGQTLVRTAPMTLTITIASDFALSLRPVVTATGIGATVSTTTTFGSAVPVTLSITGVPSGMTGTFGATQIMSGGSTSLTLARTGTVRTGTYSIVVTGTATIGGTTVTRSAGITLTVLA